MQLPLIDDVRSIQKAISVVLNSLADGTLDAKQARVMLYGLQIAATNARFIAAESTRQMKSHARRNEIAESATEAVPPPEEIATVAPLSRTDPAPAVQPEQVAAADRPEQEPMTPQLESAAAPSYTQQEAPVMVVAQPETAQESPEPVQCNSAPPSRAIRGYTEITRDRMLAVRHRRAPVTSRTA